MSLTLTESIQHKGVAYHDHGFSLLEVVAALGILSMMLMAIYEIALGGMNRAEAAKKEMLSLALAQSLMDEKLASSRWTEGRQEGESSGLTWRREISPYREDNGDNRRQRYQLYKISVSVEERVELESLKRIEVLR